MQKQLALFALVIVIGCGSDDTRDPPPPLTGAPPPLGVSCAELLTDGFTVSDPLIRVDGEPAECSASGLECPIETTPAMVEAHTCPDQQVLVARCQSNAWMLMCSAAPSVSAGGAGGADAVLLPGGAGGSDARTPP